MTYTVCKNCDAGLEFGDSYCWQCGSNQTNAPSPAPSWDKMSKREQETYAVASVIYNAGKQGLSLENAVQTLTETRELWETPSPAPSDWEAKFDKKFVRESYYAYDCESFNRDELKDFIRTLLTSATEAGRMEAVEEIKNEIKYMEEGAGSACLASEGADKSACDEANMWQYVYKKLFLHQKEKSV